MAVLWIQAYLHCPSFIVVCSVILGALVILFRLAPRSPPLPPGPAGLPVLGNLLQIPRANRHLAYFDWSRQYGPVISLKVLGKIIIVVNTRQAVQDIFEKRAAITAQRPDTVMGHYIADLNKMPGVTNNMILHRQYRRMFAQAFNPREVQMHYWDIQMEEMQRAVMEMLAGTFKNPISAIKRLKAATIPISSKSQSSSKTSSVVFSRPGVYLVEILPLLRFLPDWLPGAGFKREGQRVRQRAVELTEEPFNLVKREMLTGSIQRNFISRLLADENGKLTGDLEEEEYVKWAASTLYASGMDTVGVASNVAYVAY
ncbi:cytochrome P450 [Calocera cornea HHB12733]|uniref:Cytochrome P450 n=1 Tax=Calocera cornea HHB12733 TaxID=1353952 RepID=A0A165GUU4_9BASI|nr:cytochrome P450 [Calocera cornea HHB12733]